MKSTHIWSVSLVPHRTSLVVFQRKRNIRTLLFPLSDTHAHPYLNQRQNKDTCSTSVTSQARFPNLWQLTFILKNKGYSINIWTHLHVQYDLYCILQHVICSLWSYSTNLLTICILSFDRLLTRSDYNYI